MIKQDPIRTARIRKLLKQELIPRMHTTRRRWEYCGDVARRVAAFLVKKGYKDAWVPYTPGHLFVLVHNNRYIVDLWEPDGILKVKIWRDDDPVLRAGPDKYTYTWWTPEEDQDPGFIPPHERCRKRR